MVLVEQAATDAINFEKPRSFDYSGEWREGGEGRGGEGRGGEGREKGREVDKYIRECDVSNSDLFQSSCCPRFDNLYELFVAQVTITCIHKNTCNPHVLHM